MAETINRLSDLNVEDVFYRSYLFKEIREARFEKVIEHVVAIDEVKRPDLISFRVYKTPQLDWVVSVAAKQDDVKDEIQAGITLKLPVALELRKRIQHWATNPELPSID